MADCGDPICNIEHSLCLYNKLQKLSSLQLLYDCNLLVTCANYEIFSATLHINKIVGDTVMETLFLARCQGLSKENARLDCYKKAYHHLMNFHIEVLTCQQDLNLKVLTEEINKWFKKDPQDLINMLKICGVVALRKPVEIATRHQSGLLAKKVKTADFPPDMLASKNLSLAPTKKIELVIDQSAGLSFKLLHLTELLKEEGFTKLHIVPKIDQLALKCALHIHNVYRTKSEPDVTGKNSVTCDIVLDHKTIVTGEAQCNRRQAMESAYKKLAMHLDSNIIIQTDLDMMKSFDPHQTPREEGVDVTTKWLHEDLGALLTSNLTSQISKFPLNRWCFLNMHQGVQKNPTKRSKTAAPEI